MLYHVAMSAEREVLLWVEGIGFPFFVTACSIHVGTEMNRD